MQPTARRERRGRPGREILTLGAALALAACGNAGPNDTSDTGGSAGTGAGGGAGGGENSCEPEKPTTPADDYLSPTRALRRISLALTGRAPIASEYQAILDAKDDAARQAVLDKVVDDALASTNFYEIMRNFGREWVSMGAVAPVADVPDYMPSQQNNIAPCPAGTVHEGALAYWDGFSSGKMPCTGKNKDGTDALVKDIEPWWAPGTKITVVGPAANESPSMTVKGVTYDCGAKGLDAPNYPVSLCGCGPHLTYCHPSKVVGYANFEIFNIANPEAQRRLLWEEPARLIAHVAWNDRPLSDIILGDYSVGPVELQVAYVRAGRRLGATQLDNDDSWWRPQSFTGLVDPGHESTDPWAWREFSVTSRDPYLIASRDYKFDPREEPRGSMKGIPAAGILTMIGMLGTNTRERVRAARMMETFACESFIPPPADQKFNAYVSDPAVEGPCQACHSRIDPAAIHFKRWTKQGTDIDLDTGRYLLAGVGNGTFDDKWTSGAYPFNRDPFLHWVQWWRPETKMTPISKADAEANPEARFIDFLPPDQTLLGQKSDGTVGPLGFGKMVVASGAFDRCAVTRLHERFGGRPLDPANEPGYLDTLVEKFVKGGRKVRPFLKELTRTDVFRRGL